MRKALHFLLILFFSFSSILEFPSCNNGLKADNNEKNQANEKDNNDNQPVAPTTVNADSFFWGTWVRMDNGNEYEFLENSVLWSGKKYCVSASDDNSVTVKDLGRFNKESDSVIVCDNIPYFRKGGTNLEYSLKLVGFISSEQQSARAAGSVMPGVKGKGKSKKYKTFEDDSESDVEGIIKFKAPTVDDIQTVTITTGNDIVVIPELYISNSGDYMGTVALVGKNDYNLKITGTISDSQKDGGYLYGNNAKSYELVLTITNISENKCKSSVCTISTDDPNLNLSSETNLQGFTISTLEGGATKTLNITVSYGTLTEPYINTGINIKLTNPSTGQEWVDYIPLRFFKGTIPITISAKNPENNKNAALNGFVIYPDGNNQFFAIPHNSSKPVFVPTFGKDKSYKLVFSGATVTSKLDDSTEMYYTVEPASLNPQQVITEGDSQKLIEYMNFGGNNHSEQTAYSVTQGFEAYLSEGEIDYYTISADSDYYYSSDQIPLFEVSYENEKGSAPETILVKEESSLTVDQLPELEYEGFEFLGWYNGEQKVVVGDKISGNLVLKAGWKKVVFLVTFETEYGDVPESIAVHDGTILSSDVLPVLDNDEYLFNGWYDGENQVQVGSYVVNKDTILTAKWRKKCLITYVSEYGTVPKAIVFGSGNKITENELPKIVDTERFFLGWYKDSSLTDEKKVSVGETVDADIILYAKWYALKVPVLTSNVTIVQTDTNSTYVLFGDWPQTIKSADVIIDDSISEEHGLFTYYIGSDGCWYVKCLEDAYKTGYTYSNGEPVALRSQKLTKYFKVEPIKWHVITADYNGTGKALLLSENILIANIAYYDYEVSEHIYDTRKINGTFVYANDYKESKVRAYLNGFTYLKRKGASESNLTEENNYYNRGFLQTAFSGEAQTRIENTTINNETVDKIFLLSESEVTMFSSRIKRSTDFEKANHAKQESDNSYGNWWRLRSPSTYSGDGCHAYIVTCDGTIDNKCNVLNKDVGIVPALTVSLTN